MVICHYMQGEEEVELRGEETMVMVMRILIGVIRRTARGCVLGVDVLNILPGSVLRICLMMSSAAFLIIPPTLPLRSQMIAMMMTFSHSRPNNVPNLIWHLHSQLH